MINEDSGVIGEVEKPSVFGMIMNPKEQLEKIRNNPKSLMPVLIVTAVTFIGILLLYYSFTVPPELFEELSEQELQLALNVDRKSTRLNSSHVVISYAFFCLKK